MNSIAVAFLFLASLLFQAEYAVIQSVPVADISRKLEQLIHDREIPPDDAAAIRGALRFADFHGTGIDGRPVNPLQSDEPGYLSSRILLFGYYAEWCSNCRHNLPSALRLYEEYHELGLDFVFTFLYSNPDRVKKYVADHGLPFPVLIGSEDRQVNPDIRLQTTHYALRSMFDDYRRWGTPFYILFDKQEPDRWHIVVGEFFESDIEAFLQTRLAQTR